MPVIVQVKGQRKRRLVMQDNRFRLTETHSRRPAAWSRNTASPSAPPSSSMAGFRTILRATAGMSTGERSWRSSRRPAGARWSDATSCASAQCRGQGETQAPRCSSHATGPFPSISASFNPLGCRPSRIASTISGARQVSGRSRHT
jgi:hypothetical protein